MADLEKAILYIEKFGRLEEHARLAYTLADTPPSRLAISTLLQNQRPSGAWSPSWAPLEDSIDATCFRLMRARLLGMGKQHPSIQQALEFLTLRQQSNGFWEEAENLASVAPAWAVPGNRNATLYLTANTGFTLAMLEDDGQCAFRAAQFLASYVVSQGLPGFIHTEWLAAALWRMTSHEQLAVATETRLLEGVSDLSPSNLTWMLHVALLSGQSPQGQLCERVSSRLSELQRADGSWASDDGSEDDVRVSMDALQALVVCEQFEQHPFFN